MILFDNFQNSINLVEKYECGLEILEAPCTTQKKNLITPANDSKMCITFSVRRYKLSKYLGSIRIKQNEEKPLLARLQSIDMILTTIANQRRKIPSKNVSETDGLRTNGWLDL